MTEYRKTVKILTDHMGVAGTETVGIEKLCGRILAQDLVATENVPAYERSPYDGFAFNAADTTEASALSPVTLDIIEDIRVDQVATKKVSAGTAVRLYTGSPIPEGADAVCKYEDTEYTDKTVKIFNGFRSGENIIQIGEDIKAGSVLRKKGEIIDAGTIGTMASLGIYEAVVYKRVKASIISTGDEVAQRDEPMRPGMIRNSNRYMLAAALEKLGMDTVYTGHASDDKDDIKAMILKAQDLSDVIISTGGVSAGDRDLVPDAMEEAGYHILVHGVDMKPGMACAYGEKDGRLMLALSGNPASSLTNLQCVCYPALKKLMGYREYDHGIIRLKLKDGCKKAGKGLRFIRGRICVWDGVTVLEASDRQGNAVISSAIGCDAYAMIPGGTGPLEKGSEAEGFRV